MHRVVFSSDELPAELDSEARFKLWRDLYVARHGEADMASQADLPFTAEAEFVSLGPLFLARFDVAVRRVARTRRQVAADARDDFIIGFNRGGPQSYVQRGREVVETGRGGLFYTNAEPGEGRAQHRAAIVGLSLPRAMLLDLVTGAEDMVGTPLDPANPAVRHLGRYLDFLLESDDLGDNAGHDDVLATTILDLVALALGANRDATEAARLRGLRAARVHAILAEIKTGFSDPAFTVRNVAAKLHLAPRYVQNLLSETSANFTERVLELRLQKARSMLSDPRHDRLKVSEIAYACGFNEISYFNRCFRRRFGATPTEFRGRNGRALS
jgi:AraC-like DNA-binding protein